MTLIVPPFYDRISRWAVSSADNVLYPSPGMYRGYINDGGSTGQTHTWAQAWEAHTGQSLEVIMGSMSLSLGNHTAAIMSFKGCPQHIYLQVPMTAGNHLSATLAGTNDSFWNGIVDDLTSASLDHGHVTMVLGWEAGYGSFDWAIGPNSQTAAQYASAFRKVVNVMRARGFTGTFGYDTSGMNSATRDAAYPGDTYVDLVGTHHYNSCSGPSARADVAAWLVNEMGPRMDAVTAFCVAHGKLGFCSEWGIEVPAPGDTSSNTWKYHTVDTTLFIPWMHDYYKTNAAVWASMAWFNQDVGYPNISEYIALFYNGTNPSSQSPNGPHDTNGAGPVFDALAGTGTHRVLSTPAHYLSVMIPGTMQPSGGGGGGGGGGVIVSSSSKRPRILTGGPV